MSDVNSRMHWTVAVIEALRASTRPSGGLNTLLSSEELDEMRSRYAQGWTAAEFAECLVERDNQAADRVRSTSREENVRQSLGIGS